MSSLVCEIDANHAIAQTSNVKHDVQFVPAKIGFSGQQDVHPYFSNFIKENENGSYDCALRGRPLNGHVVEVPKGYTGLVLKTESANRLSEKTETKAHLVKRVSQMTVWNYDDNSETGENNPVSNAMKWIKLAQILHSDETE